jgi:hypothetical protein
MQQLLWFETVLKASVGAALLLAPGLVATICGLPPATVAYWPRIVGALLLGIAAGVYLDAVAPAMGGIGIGGLIMINLAGATALLSLVILKRGAIATRGRISDGAAIALLLGLALVEIAFVKVAA